MSKEYVVGSRDLNGFHPITRFKTEKEAQEYIERNNWYWHGQLDIELEIE